jgi:hypothetical protein
MTNPYVFDETFRSDEPCIVRLIGRGPHPTSVIRYEGPLQIEICTDPACAAVRAKCMHAIQEGDKAVSICEWDESGNTLTCQYCGVDGT